jgi:hypothetical protein
LGAQHPNNFLASLSAKDFELLRPHLKPFDMVHEDLLFDTGETLFGPICRTAVSSRSWSDLRTAN